MLSIPDTYYTTCYKNLLRVLISGTWNAYLDTTIIYNAVEIFYIDAILYTYLVTAGIYCACLDIAGTFCACMNTAMTYCNVHA